ncbi:hypothetical protein [Helicobacter suis]|uniref:hypothetical protein n=1 Tax=Helicobacter suis TaxID=104628 RepID=UPI001596AD05|nr:hypothetical protein [Helicobacter suis]
MDFKKWGFCLFCLLLLNIVHAAPTQPNAQTQATPPATPPTAPQNARPPQIHPPL